MDELVTAGGLRVDPVALSWTSVRSGGSGGQHANTSDTAVTVRLDVAAAHFPEAVRDRIVSRLGWVVTARASDTRSQWRNRQLAWERLGERLDGATVVARRRKSTCPSRGAVAERLDDKRHRSDLKRTRQRSGRPSEDD